MTLSWQLFLMKLALFNYSKRINNSSLHLEQLLFAQFENKHKIRGNHEPQANLQRCLLDGSY